jgi:hypothetical protein
MLGKDCKRNGGWILALASGMFFLLQSLTVLAEGNSASPTDDPLARSIVEKADKVRFPAEGFQVDIVINSLRPDKDAELRKYRVLSKGNENTVVMVTEPAAERGQIILMKGRDLWVFMPDVSQPVRISLAQRLTGQVGYIFLFATIMLYAGIGIMSNHGGRRRVLRGRPARAGAVQRHGDRRGLDVAASFIGMAGTLYLPGYDGLAFIMGWTGGYCLVALFLAPYLRKFGQFTIPDFLGARYGGHLPR